MVSEWATQRVVWTRSLAGNFPITTVSRIAILMSRLVGAVVLLSHRRGTTITLKLLDPTPTPPADPTAAAPPPRLLLRAAPGACDCYGCCCCPISKLDDMLNSMFRDLVNDFRCATVSPRCCKVKSSMDSV